MYAFILCTDIVGFFVWTLSDRPGKAVRRLCGERTEIVRCRCSCPAVSTDSARNSYSSRPGSVQRPRGAGAVTVRSPYDFFWPIRPSKSWQFPQDHRAASARCPNIAPVPSDFFLNLSSLNKIVETTVPLNPYGNHTVAVCLRMEASR